MSKNMSSKNSNNLRTRLFRLLENAKESGDLHFLIKDSNDRRISAHKLIVELASPELYAMINGSVDIPGAEINAENLITLNVDGISVESFMEILRYIYTDAANINEVNAFEIMLKAIYYGLPELKEDCIEHLMNNLNYSNCLSMYNFFWNMECGFFGYKKTVTIMIRYRPKATAFNNSLWLDLNADTVCSILSLPTMNCDEIERFCALLAWIKNNPNNLKPSLFDCIKLNAITLQEFDQSIEHYGLGENHIITDIRKLCIGDKTASRRYFTYQGTPWRRITYSTITQFLFIRNEMGLYLRSGSNYCHPCKTESRDGVISWSRSNRRDISEVLSGDGYELVTVNVNDDIPHNAVIMNNSSINDKFPEFVGIANNKFGIIDWLKCELAITQSHQIDTEECVPFPVQVLVARNMIVYNHNTENVPPDAFCINRMESEANPLYLGHACHPSGDILPAIIDHQARTATATYGHQKYVFTEYKFNRHAGKENVCWVPANPFPSLRYKAVHYPIACGRTSAGEVLYFGRSSVNSKLVYGKIHLMYKALFYACNDAELPIYSNYEVLVRIQSNVNRKRALIKH